MSNHAYYNSLEYTVNKAKCYISVINSAYNANYYANKAENEKVESAQDDALNYYRKATAQLKTCQTDYNLTTILDEFIDKSLNNTNKEVNEEAYFIQQSINKAECYLKGLELGIKLVENVEAARDEQIKSKEYADLYLAQLYNKKSLDANVECLTNHSYATPIDSHILYSFQQFHMEFNNAVEVSNILETALLGKVDEAG